MQGAIYVEGSNNAKLGFADSTYASIEATCPKSCPLKSNGCYAQEGHVFFTSARMNKEAALGPKGTPGHLPPLTVARAEAKLIDASHKGGPVPPDRILRLHVSGDARTRAAAQTLGKAVKRWRLRGGKGAWSYTHAWRKVLRSDWGFTSVLASMEAGDKLKANLEAARRNGYAPAVVVESFPSERAFRLPGVDVELIPCPAQTKHVTCSSCRLCLDDRRFFETKRGIAFAVHGTLAKNKRRLEILNS